MRRSCRTTAEIEMYRSESWRRAGVRTDGNPACEAGKQITTVG
jgi:hypothetical protein